MAAPVPAAWYDGTQHLAGVRDLPDRYKVSQDRSVCCPPVRFACSAGVLTLLATYSRLHIVDWNGVQSQHWSMHIWILAGRPARSVWLPARWADPIHRGDRGGPGPCRAGHEDSAALQLQQTCGYQQSSVSLTCSQILVKHNQESYLELQAQRGLWTKLPSWALSGIGSWVLSHQARCTVMVDRLTHQAECCRNVPLSDIVCSGEHISRSDAGHPPAFAATPDCILAGAGQARAALYVERPRPGCAGRIVRSRGRPSGTG
jgi:hypothetical protein